MRSLSQIICEIAKENNVDIIFLAEYEDNIQSLICALDMQSYFTLGCDRIKVIGKKKNVEPGIQGTRYSIQIIENKYILCAMHLPSQMRYGHQERRNIIIQTILNDLQDTEKRLNSKRTIILGDFNEDPYEDGCLSAVNFHGLPSMNDALKSYRIIEGKQFEMFYNPMWNLLGDFSFPPGTYYYMGNEVNNSFWNIYDQVMIRPCIRDFFVDSELKIICETKNGKLIDENNHPSKNISDHLPIIFEIKEF